MDAVVFGNVTLDVICYPVNDVPRYDSISFEKVIVGPGGCGSNVAIGLAALKVPVALVAKTGQDESAHLVTQAWQKWGIDLSQLTTTDERPTAVSVGLVDSSYQPRFIHTSGANGLLTVDDLHLDRLVGQGARALMVAGFFVLPGLLDGRLPLALRQARTLGMLTILDVVNSPRMDTPDGLWPCLPHLDVLLCNLREAERMTHMQGCRETAAELRKRQAGAVIVKLGAAGCWVDWARGTALVPAEKAPVVDTTGAGDAFAAGLTAALLSGASLLQACEAGNQAGGRMIGSLGAVAGWGAPDNRGNSPPSQVG